MRLRQNRGPQFFVRTESSELLKLRGIEIIIEDQRNGDLGCWYRVVNGVMVRIACKRSYSANNISTAIKKANNNYARPFDLARMSASSDAFPDRATMVQGGAHHREPLYD